MHPIPTPDRITRLDPGQVFVFGSNLAGIHGGGAAALAYKKFGAQWGVGVGFTGDCYALPTKDRNIETLPLSEIAYHVEQFLLNAAYFNRRHFLVTQIGCGLAGLTPAQIAPLFANIPHCPIPDNVSLPQSFITILKTVSFTIHP